ncbi:MAG: transporter, partial [Aeoliella sp.]
MARSKSIATFQVLALLAMASAACAQDPPGDGSIDPPEIPGTSGPTELPPNPFDLPSPPGFDDSEDFPSPPDPSEPPSGVGDTTPTPSQPRVPAQQALQQQTGPQPQGQFNIRLARAPKMLGDFFGRGGTSVTVAERTGEAVHQTIISGSAFANDNLSLITIDGGTGKTVFVGGPAGLTPGSFFLPSIPPPLGDVVTGLTANGTSTGEMFTAVLTPGTTDVFDNPADVLPSIPDAPIYNMFEVYTLFLPASNPGDLVGRVRMQDNNSAFPEDRVYFDYNHFHNVRLAANGFDVNRFTTGIEKTFWDGMGSLEVRMPIATPLNSSTSVGGPPDTSNSEFGNLTLAPKLVVWKRREEAIAIGLGITLPTSDDIEVFAQSGEQLMRVQSDAVHLIPYIAYVYAPRCSEYFVNAFLTADFDTGGNPVEANVTGNGLEHAGVINDQTILSVSGSIGKFVYRNKCRASTVKSIAWTTELHYTAAVSDADFINVGAFRVGSPQDDISLLDATIGAYVRLPKSTLTLGYTT